MGEGGGRFSGDFDTSGDKNVPLICMDLVRNYKRSFAKYQNFRLRRAAQTTIRIVALLIYRGHRLWDRLRLTLNIENHFLHFIQISIDQDYREFNKCAYGANIRLTDVCV